MGLVVTKVTGRSLSVSRAGGAGSGCGIASGLAGHNSPPRDISGIVYNRRGNELTAGKRVMAKHCSVRGFRLLWRSETNGFIE